MQKNEYECVLSEFLPDRVIADIISEKKSDTEPPYFAELYQALPKGDKLDTVIQKAVECGVSTITTFMSERCIAKEKGDEENKLRRRAKIALEAAKQSGRAILPTVSHAVSFSKMLDLATKSELALLCYESEEGKTLKGAIGERDIPKSLACIVGCEGGFSREEAEEAIARGIVSVSLGKRILRCETAPDFILSALEYEFEL
jgi:16S rRNA (uracil1498-N3)-methyltransferase